MDLKEIRTLVDLMKKNGIAVFKMEKEGFKITMKTGEAGGPVHFVTSAPPPAATSATLPAAPAAAEAPVSAPAIVDGIEIKSPMVGTFYGSPSPENPPFVSPGQEVTPETVVCIIEAMKVMNEIKAEAKGVITQVMVENAKPVEFGQPLYKIRPS